MRSSVRLAFGNGYFDRRSALWISPHNKRSTCDQVGAVVTTIPSL
jgi:hypothetical protein